MYTLRTADAPRLHRRGGRRLAHSVLAAVSVAALAIGGILSVTRASAMYEEIAETGSPGMLQLRADSTRPLWSTLAPGESMQWLVEASLDDADRGTLALELRSGGSLVDPGGLTASVVSCDRDFAPGGAGSEDPPRCDGQARTELPPTPLAQISTMESGDTYSLADLDREQPRHLLVTLALPAQADAVGGDDRAVVGLGLHAAGDRETPDPPDPRSPDATPETPQQRGPLAMTGGDLSALALLAAGLLGLGALALMRRRASAPPAEAGAES